MAELTDDVIDTIIAESVGDGVPGMTAVGWAIANRAAKGNTSPDAVVKKPKQFDGYSNPGKGVRAAQNDPRIRAQVKEIWSGIENRTIPDPLYGGTMFHASSMTPYWSDAENKHGTVRIGNQTYYKGGHALPPGELPAVGTLTDTVPPRAVAPVTPSIDLAQMRRTTVPTRLIQDSFGQLPQRLGSSKLADSLALSPIQGGRQTAPPFDAAFDTRSGAMRMLAQPEAVSSQGLGVGTSRPPAPIPAQPSPQLAGRRATDPVLQTALNSRFPTPLPPIPPSTLGQAPSTRIVQSVPVTPPTPPKPLPRVTVTTPYNLQQHLVGQDAGNVPRALPAPTQTAFVPEARYIEPRNAAIPDRLPSTPMAGRLAAPPTVVFDRSYSPAEVTGTVAQTIRPTGSLAPLPRQTIARVPLPADPYRAVGSELDTAMPALPRPRPDLGMGGVDIPGAISQTGQVAPTPMPRLQRPGIFGRPQVFGHDVPLPGIFGVLQNATMAMNNASGPFRTGADNALYNGLRGGDFNARGAATAQSGGFIYAPKPGGGFINVGRSFPAVPAPAIYDSLNRRNDSRDDAANRVNGSSSRGSGGARSLLD